MSYGNIFFANLDGEGYDKHIKLAKDFYEKVLGKEPSNNIYAANGLGMVLAEKNFLAEAKEVFSQVLGCISCVFDPFSIRVSIGSFVRFRILLQPRTYL